jgi:DNA topoisomerase-3
MLAFAVSLAARKGLALPRGCKSSLARCRAYLDAEAGPAASRAAMPGAADGPRPPSAAMLRYARRLAAERGLDCPPEIETQFAACRGFLDAHAAPAAAGAPTGRAARQARPGPAKPKSSPSAAGKPDAAEPKSRTPRRRPAAARAASGA